MESRTHPDLPLRTRRRLLAGLAALAGAHYLPGASAQAASALSPAQFTALSQSLTGLAYKDPALASSLLRAIAADIGAPTLAKIATVATSTPAAQLDAALRSAGVEVAAARVLVALYSGVVETPKGPVVLTYTDALGWQAVPWTKPNAVCGGPTDYWATAPANT